MTKNPVISQMGDHGVLLQWDFDFSPENLKLLLSAKAKIYRLFNNPEFEVTNTFTSLLLRYPSGHNSLAEDMESLKKIDFNQFQNVQIEQRLIEIPVCYNAHFGLDLELLSIQKKMDIDALINVHTAPIYTVYFIGFLPGFPYLGGLDNRLSFPRKKAPRPRIEQGAVGIAENQTGIYPQSSPAGWQIIGNCPLKLFDPTATAPCLLKAGDAIKFRAVDKQEHSAIQTAVEKGTYKPVIKLKNG